MKHILRRGFLRALGAFFVAAPAVALLPDKANALVLVDRTDWGIERANFNGVRPALQAAVMKAMSAAGFAGQVAAGYIEDTDYVWARWTTWDGPKERHVLVRAPYSEYQKDPAAFQRSFIKICKTKPPAPRGASGLIPSVVWQA